MDQDRIVREMTDDVLAGEVSRLLLVDPSPDFHARVRMRLAAGAVSPSWRSSWRFALAGGLAMVTIVAALVVAALQNHPGQAVLQPSSSLSARSLVGVPVPLMPERRSTMTDAPAGEHRDAVQSGTPQLENPLVLVWASDVRALQTVIARSREGYFIPPPPENAEWEDEGLLPPELLTIAPIEIEPLPSLSLFEEGERP
jgi:hypothetical protein